MSDMFIPNVPVRSPSHKDGTGPYIDVFSYLLQEAHAIIVPPVIDKAVTHSIITQLLYLDAEHSNVPISLYMNTVGGAPIDIFTIYDAMQFIHNEISVVCLGESYGFPTLLLAGAKPKSPGAKGLRRFALPRARIMLPPKLVAKDIGLKGISEKENTELMRLRAEIAKMLAEDTKQSLEKVTADIERRNFVLNVEEAIQYGIIDEVLKHRRNPYNP